MKESTQKILVIGFFLLAIAIIGALDVGLNIISLIPGVGDAAETASETVLETLQFLVSAVGLLIASYMKK